MQIWLTAFLFIPGKFLFEAMRSKEPNLPRGGASSAHPWGTFGHCDENDIWLIILFSTTIIVSSFLYISTSKHFLQYFRNIITTRKEIPVPYIRSKYVKWIDLEHLFTTRWLPQYKADTVVLDLNLFYLFRHVNYKLLEQIFLKRTIIWKMRTRSNIVGYVKLQEKEHFSMILSSTDQEFCFHVKLVSK